MTAVDNRARGHQVLGKGESWTATNRGAALPSSYIKLRESRSRSFSYVHYYAL